MAAHTTVLDDLDDETAHLIIKCQLEELTQLEREFGAGSEGGKDGEVARRFYEAELKAYRALRGFAEEEAQAPDEGDGVDQQPSPPAAAPDGVPRFECSVCDERNVSDYDYSAPCGHHYCGDCLSDLFATSMRDERFYPPRCCNQHILFESAGIFLRKEVETEFADKKEELDDSRRTYCHVPTCSTYVPQSHKQADVARCPSCQQETCILCHGATHEGDCPPDEAAQSVIDTASQEGWQRCYSCQRMVELTIGCNHITCHCRAQFCYVCGERWRTCRCPQFHEERLLARAEQVADREGGNAAELAEQLRQHHECQRGDHEYERIEGGGDCDECGEYLRVFIWRCENCHTDICSRCRFNL
ncbi:hypothetical protein M409DRAFT_29450 [Zasmidium cellare ATCC 36951]|uniref:RBR-type E3 ubiquitin transferase n=1 Tax=Zasmidium cellare ATCC 36951 TaxID=1080233 RepID=A0A6A6BZJ1_ZASCE|nr:uncharacterized protein M409DRAFT_29450 [Zasmidium cellare ATCC 36951]KAF2160155.1 hypothetical protein M409DRAFT_29450 [Zasmidium cellare ATCC 36951]